MVRAMHLAGPVYPLDGKDMSCEPCVKLTDKAENRLVRIILVDDNASLAQGICYRLQDAGHAVDVIGDGQQAADFLRHEPSDLVILDINLPGMDGISILRDLRERGDTRPVLLLTARSDTVDRVRGLDAGADDYLVKPFEMVELEARVRALSRRTSQAYRQTLEFGPVALDLDARQVEIDGASLPIPRREVSLLEALLAAEGRTVSKAQLLEHTYGTGSDVEEAAVETHISRLRKRLRPHGVQIVVQRGLGYALALETGP
jgi:DNA-binding response OmpR family regulator